MNNFLSKIDLKTLIIIGLVMFLLFMRNCSGGDTKPGETIKVNGKKYEVIKHEIDTQYVEITKTVYKDGKTIFRDIPIYTEVPSDVDTNEILKDYFSKVVYKDTLKLTDSLGYIVINDTITKNSILNRVWDTHVNKLTIKETLYLKELPKNRFYYGVFGGYNNLTSVYLGPYLSFEGKKDRGFTLGAATSFSPNGGIIIQGSIYNRIKRKK